MLSPQSPKSLFITAIIDDFLYSICAWNTIFGVRFYMPLQKLSKLVHHIGFMLHKGMGIAVERYSRILVTENLGERFHIHAAL